MGNGDASRIWKGEIILFLELCGGFVARLELEVYLSPCRRFIIIRAPPQSARFSAQKLDEVR